MRRERWEWPTYGDEVNGLLDTVRYSNGRQRKESKARERREDFKVVEQSPAMMLTLSP